MLNKLASSFLLKYSLTVIACYSLPW